jgi:DNA-binding CsgD family transcriptional regulator
VTVRAQAADRLPERVLRECARAQEPLELLRRVARLVRAEIPYAAAGWLLVDPDTLLLTGVHAEHVTREQHLRLIECELTEDDVTKFVDLALAGTPAASLSDATGGDLARSARWREVYAPAGFGDELRAVFTTGPSAWGHACLTRAAGEPFFSPAEVAAVAAVAPLVGHGIRTCLLLAGVDTEPAGTSPALVVLDDDGAVEVISPQARDWLGDVADDDLEGTIVLHEVAGQARALARGGAGRPACARTRTREGEWLVVRAARLEGSRSGKGRTAVVLEPARRADVAPVLLRLHQLTPREREVTQLLLTGMAIADIAARLWITPETLRGHVKSVFGKLGVNSRPQLAALLSSEPVISVATLRD